MSRLANRVHERGSALIAALFLVVVVAVLGVFAIRLGVDQRQTTTLQLLQYRTDSAAQVGLEFMSHQIASNSSVACPAAAAGASVPIGSFEGFRNIAVNVTCIRTSVGGGYVYEVTSTARHGNFGAPDFVKRIATRRISNVGRPTW